MLKTIPATHAKNNFGDVIRRVYEHDEIQVVEKDGVPVVGIISISDLERLYPHKIKSLPRAAASSRRQQAIKQLHTVLNRMGTDKFSEEEVMADVLKTQKKA